MLIYAVRCVGQYLRFMRTDIIQGNPNHRTYLNVMVYYVHFQMVYA